MHPYHYRNPDLRLGARPQYLRDRALHCTLRILPAVWRRARAAPAGAVEDVATACIAALQSTPAGHHAYNLSGAERLTYREMVARVFRAMDKPARFMAVPLPVFRLAIVCLRIWPRFRNWSAAMAERMNTDLVFDHADAIRDLGYSPRAFQPGKTDLPTFGAKNHQ